MPARTLSLVLSRAVDGGMHESHGITNHGRTTVRFNLEIAVRSDFADIFEVKSGHIVRRGRISSAWRDADGVLTTGYSNGAFYREVRITAARPGAGGLCQRAHQLRHRACAPGATWDGALLYDLQRRDRSFPAPTACDLGRTAGRRGSWRHGGPGVLKLDGNGHRLRAHVRRRRWRTSRPCACRWTTRGGPAGRRRSPRRGCRGSWRCSGGTRSSSRCRPSSWTRSSRGRRWRCWGAGRRRSGTTTATPSRARSCTSCGWGELAALHLIPHTPYYGTADATPLYLMVLHATWKATGDLDMVRRHLGDRRGLPVLDRRATATATATASRSIGTRSGQGYENVGWKDSGEAVVNADGSKVSRPQGAVRAAGLRVRRLARHGGGVSPRWATPAGRRRWRPRRMRCSSGSTRCSGTRPSGFYAYCLDGDKRPMLTVASNAGHLLWCGIVPPDRAARVVARLMQPDMWSGWGIRTLTAQNPSYNPYSLPERLGLAARQQPDRAGVQALRLPCRRGDGGGARTSTARPGSSCSGSCRSCIPGVQRDETSFPVQYLGANVPQAWAAGSVFALVQAMLGLQPDAPDGRAARRPGAAGLAAGPDAAGPAGGRDGVRHRVPAGGGADGV